MERKTIRGLIILLFTALSLAISGCGGGSGGKTTVFDVSGTVTQENQEAIAGVTVEAKLNGTLLNATITGDDGSYSLTGLTKSPTITASKNGWHFSESIKVSGPQDTVDFTGHVLEYNLTIEVQGEGSIHSEVVANVQNSSTHPYGTTIRLTAIPEPGWTFVHWAGDAFSDTENPLEIFLDKDISITGVFVEEAKLASLVGSFSFEHNFPYSLLDQTSPPPEKTVVPRPFAGLSDPIEEDQIDELIISFHERITESQQERILAKLGYTIIERIPALNAVVVSDPQADVFSSMAVALEYTEIRYAEPNYPVRALELETPNDEYYKYQWGPPLIRLPQAWELGIASSHISVAVLDTGIDVNHSDLVGPFEGGYNFVESNSIVSDKHGHGTHVAGIIGAVSKNHKGIAGVMPGVSLVPVKVLNDNGSGTMDSVIKGILYAAGFETTAPSKLPAPVDIINMSLGVSSDSQSLRDAIEKADQAGVIVVAASGNTGDLNVHYPAAYPEVIAVGSVDYSKNLGVPERSDFSCYGSQLDVVAPGGAGFGYGIYSTYLSDSYEEMQGTSMATPHVAGLIGLMVSNGVSKSDVGEVLRQTSMDLGTSGFDIDYGYGMVNAYWAVNGVNEVKVLVGSREGDRIQAVAETFVELSPDGGKFKIGTIPPGEHQVYAWVDVLDNGVIDPGDYLAELAGPIKFEAGQSYGQYLILEEVEKLIE